MKGMVAPSSSRAMVCATCLSGMPSVVAISVLNGCVVVISFLLFFVLPISLRPLTMLKIAAALEFLGLAYTFAGGDAVVAYSAHIGGLVSGVAFVCALRRLKNAHFKSPFARSRAGWNPKGGRASDYPFKVNISDSKDLSREIDRILDKISRDGFASLSDEERETLRRARDSLK